DVVARWPYFMEEEFINMRVAFVHYSLDNSGRDFAAIVPHPSTDTLDRLFARHRADLVFYGHDHAASDVHGHGRYVNPGSLGCFTEPVARFVVLDINQDGTYMLVKHAVPYDDTDLLGAFEERQVPERE